MAVGYSGKSVHAKLGIKPGDTVAVLGAPSDYPALINAPGDGTRYVTATRGKANVVHLFTTKRADLARRLPGSIDRIAPDGMIWVSWPKRVSGVATDVTEDVIREIALPLGLVDVKVCAIDETWSGLKLVIRKDRR
jgi:hypothetical protein